MGRGCCPNDENGWQAAPWLPGRRVPRVASRLHAQPSMMTTAAASTKGRSGGRFMAEQAVAESPASSGSGWHQRDQNGQVLPHPFPFAAPRPTRIKKGQGKQGRGRREAGTRLAWKNHIWAEGRVIQGGPPPVIFHPSELRRASGSRFAELLKLESPDWSPFTLYC